MRLLLDTHAFLWWVDDDERLTRRARKLIADPRNKVFVSVISAMEIVVKAGKLSLREAPEQFIQGELERNAFETLALKLAHVLAIAKLPALHHDPFDRVLVAQAASEDLTLVTGDRLLKRYPAKTAW